MYSTSGKMWKHWRKSKWVKESSKAQEKSATERIYKKKKKVQYLKPKERIENMLTANIVMYITEPMQKRKEIKPPS